MSPLRSLVSVAIFSAASALPAQQRDTAKGFELPAFSQKLPVDPKLKIGTLPNGIRYYIRKNAKPEKRAELRLVVNAGSVLEKDNQLGLAHFVEHTAFNGTKHFSHNDLVKYLQSIGVRFGADLNAYTSFDETVYILPVPTDTARIIEQAFTILEDWAHGQTFDSTEVVNERGVVHEEWRLGRGAGERMLTKILPIALKGSKYADRLPIGTEASIMSGTPSRLRSFYRDWYRPDLMAVVAVGDFDPAVIEAQIKKHFAGIPRATSAPKRVSPAVPGNKAPLIAIASDKEATSTQVELFFKVPKDSFGTVSDYRRSLMEQLYFEMLNDRLNEIAQKPGAPFLGAGAGKGGFVSREVVPFSLGAAVEDGGVEKGLEALLLEAKRVDQFGFQESELSRAKSNTLRGYEAAYAERDKSQSGPYADEYIRHFLAGEPTPGIAYEYALTQRLLPTITVADINKMASAWITDSNRVVIVEAPEKAGVALPTEASILAVFDRAAKTPVQAYAENVSTDALIDAMRPAGSIVSTRQVAGTDVLEWKLSNGARVFVKPTDFKDDEILFAGQSPGGTSLAPDSNYMSAELASQVVDLSGIGKFTRIDLGKKLAGKNAHVSAGIDDDNESVSGSASPKDLETLMQLTYLQFTGARLDTSAWLAFKTQVGPFLANRGASPDQVFRDTVQVTMAQHDFRARPISPATFAEVSPEKALAFYRDRFADAGDFTFAFVGNVDTTTLKPLVEKYLASLPSTGRKDVPRVVTKGPPPGVIERVVHKGVEPKASTILTFTGPCVYSPENRVAIRALVEAFQIRVIELLREKLGGTYSPNVSGGCGRTPRQEYSISIRYGSSPENVEGLTKAVLALIDTMQTTGPTASDVERVKEQIIRGREVQLKQNSYWLSGILSRDEAGEDIAGLLAPYDDLVKNISAAQIQQSAKQYFNTKNYARFVLLPEKTP